MFSRELSARHARLCRAVEIGPAETDDFSGDADASYGNRVFLHHYCIPLGTAASLPDAGPYPGDRHAARGFNGDIGECLARWREVADVASPSDLRRRIARKTLLAVAGLVSVEDPIWTTDRESSATRWGRIRPELAENLQQLSAWADGAESPSALTIARAVAPRGIVSSVVKDFEHQIGLWP